MQTREDRQRARKAQSKPALPGGESASIHASSAQRLQPETGSSTGQPATSLKPYSAGWFAAMASGAEPSTLT
eukprot:scaffold19549_cov49-Prasinocladus_malaysianus.AAC.1